MSMITHPASAQETERAASAASFWAIQLGVAALLALFVCALYYPLLFTNRVLASGDILHYFYPYRDYAAAALRAGHIPLWNPYIFLGAPFLANPQAAVLYPLHWPLSWLPVTKQIYCSAALHTWLLGMGGFVLMRHWRASVWASLIAALLLAGSGFYGGLLGHINQMNGATWLPWALLILERTTSAARATADARTGMVWWRAATTWLISPDSLLNTVLFGLLVALMILAGHSQTAYINLFGAGVWVMWPHLPWRQWRMPRALLVDVWPRVAVYSGGGLLGLLLCGAQLAPTLELSRLGLRSGGLNYWDATSFSLRPFKLPWTLLPSYGLADLNVVFDSLGYTEYVAYLGLIGFGLALLGARRGRGDAAIFGMLFAALGFFLALGRWNPGYYLLYRLAPGFDLFRAPARWMMLYTLGMAVLAGVGLDLLLARTNRRNRLFAAGALTSLLIAFDLILAARALPHTQTTAPQAIYALRTAPAYLLTDPARSSLDPAAAGRFLSMSTITFDPGDMADLRRILLESEPPQLTQQAFEQLLIALKSQEILAPNLPLLWRVPAVDGFDGGVLPLQRFVRFLSLFISPDELVPDGRLREQLSEIPETGLLGLLNAQYVITDKVRDLWFDGVYYDRQIGARLDEEAPSLEIEVPLPFSATHVDLIGYVAGEGRTATPEENQVAAVVSVASDDGAMSELALVAGGRPGAHFADGALDSPAAAAGEAVVAFRDVEAQREEYLARLALPAPATPTTITIQWQAAAPAVQIQAVTLFDQRTGMFTALLPSDNGRFRLAHSGDVKVYENLDVQPRAYLIHDVVSAPSPDAALETMRQGMIDFRSTAVVEGLAGFQSKAHPDDRVDLLAYAPEQVTVQATTTQRGLLVLADTHYPGWSATVDGEPAPIFSTNYLLRGVELPPGKHIVRFSYAPHSWQRGLWLSALGASLCLVMLAAWMYKRFRARLHRDV